MHTGKPLRRFPLPPVLLAVDAIGALLFGVGVAALVADLSGLAPALANENVAGALVAIGLAAMMFAGLKIVQHLRAAGTEGRSR